MLVFVFFFGGGAPRNLRLQTTACRPVTSPRAAQNRQTEAPPLTEPGAAGRKPAAFARRPLPRRLHAAPSHLGIWGCVCAKTAAATNHVPAMHAVQSPSFAKQVKHKRINTFRDRSNTPKVRGAINDAKKGGQSRSENKKTLAPAEEGPLAAQGGPRERAGALQRTAQSPSGPGPDGGGNAKGGARVHALPLSWSDEKRVIGRLRRRHASLMS